MYLFHNEMNSKYFFGRFNSDFSTTKFHQKYGTGMNNHFKNILSLPCFFTQKGKNKIAFTSIVKWLNIKLVFSQLD